MNWEVITVIIGSVGGATGIVELIKYLATRKAQRRHAEGDADLAAATADTEEWHIWKDQIERMNEQIETKDGRIEKLNNQLAEKENRFQEQVDRYIEQTKRLRDIQDREYQANLQVAKLTKEVGELKLFIEEQQCRKLTCPYRRPLNQHARKAIADLGIDIAPHELPDEDPEPILQN